jgi:hypothetical protein
MMEERTNLEILKEMIGQLPKQDQIEVENCALKIRSMCDQHKEAAPVAMALVAAEMDQA